MNKGIKETKSDTKRNKNLSKIATRVIGEKKRSPTRGKDRSSSMNSLVSSERADNSSKKILQSEVKPKMLNETSSKKVSEVQKSVDGIASPLKDQRTTQSAEKTLKTTERIEDQSTRTIKSTQRENFFHEMLAREGSIEKLLQIEKPAKTVFNVDEMSSTQIQESLTRVDKKTPKPFSFLTDIIDRPKEEKPKLIKDIKDQELNPTDIDLQLTSLVKRVELNRTLLERANQRVKDINFLTERNRAISIREMNYDEESFLRMKELGDTCKEPVSAAADLAAVSHPAVDELQKTMTATIEMLGHVHKMSSIDLASGDIPQVLTEYLSTTVTTGENL